MHNHSNFQNIGDVENVSASSVYREMKNVENYWSNI